MDRSSRIILEEYSKILVKKYFLPVLLLVFFLGLAVAKSIVSSDVALENCVVREVKVKFKIDGNKPFYVCELKTGELANVYLNGSMPAGIGSEVSIEIHNRPLWIRDVYRIESSSN